MRMRRRKRREKGRERNQEGRERYTFSLGRVFITSFLLTKGPRTFANPSR
jgi:hypothetical protein